MKILFIVRSTLYTVKGGDTIQVIETACHLRQLGIEVDVELTGNAIDYSQYNILHFFNITRPADILVHIKRSKKPFVISPILIDYAEYDKQYRQGLAGKLFRILPATRIEYLKTLYRSLRRKDRLISLAYLWKGQSTSIKQILQQAAYVLVNAEEEYTQLVKLYPIQFKRSLIYNGINVKLFKSPGKIERQENLVICVARIEGIKNQYNLIKALNNTKYKLLLIGDAAPNQKEYYERCKDIAAANISFIPHLPQQQLLNYYAAAKVHILPSWFEVCGLSSLEAAAMGCRIVVTDKGYARSYFLDDAFYCDPAKPECIFGAVEKAALSLPNEKLKQRIIDQYNWQQTADNILSVYKKVLA